MIQGAPLREEHAPFHERHNKLLILCSLTGLHTRAVERVVTTKWKRRLLRFWCTLIHIILSSIYPNNLAHLFFAKKSALQAIHSVMLLGCSTHSVFRQYYMHKYIDKFDELYLKWDELFGKDGNWNRRQKSTAKHYRNAEKVIGNLGIASTIMWVIYMIAVLMADEKVFRVPTVIPYRHQSPDYEILACYFSLTTIIHAIAVSSSQYLLLLPIIWELGELTRLQQTLEEIIVDGESITEEFTTEDGETVKAKSYTVRGIATVRKNMKIWVDHHQKLKNFHKMSANLNNFELGMEMVATFLEACAMAVLCGSNYYAPVDEATTIVGFAGYFALFYYSCSKCNELSDMSQVVADDAFAQNWSALPIKMKKNFLMIVTTTLQPFNYYGAYIFRIDKMTFMQIFQTAYSVFNFFLTVV